MRLSARRQLLVVSMMGLGFVLAGCGASSESGGPGGRDGAVTGSGGSGGSNPGTGGATGGSGGAGGSGGTGGSRDAGVDLASSGGATGTDARDVGAADSQPATDVAGGDAAAAERFSFFVTSIEAMRALSGSQNGFGGDLRYGEATGLAGADKICAETANRGRPGAGTAKTWRAFLSATTGGPGGGPVNAIDRIGMGPWYDRLGRLVAMTRADLQQTRPRGASPMIINDLPNETGLPNRQGTDNHDTLTGSNAMGMLLSMNATGTCNDWTSAVGSTGRPMLGHSWPAGSGMSWIQAHSAAGCGAAVNINSQGPAPQGSSGVGSGGGYGGIYCFALTP